MNEPLSRPLGPLAAAALLALAGCTMTPLAPAPRLVAGPMPGAPEPTAATVWVQTDRPGAAELAYWDETDPKQVRRAGPLGLTAAGAFAGTVRVEGLEPGHRYRYRLLLNDQPVEFPQPLQFQTAPREGEVPPVRIAAGSCHETRELPAGAADPYRIFDTILGFRPDLMVWLGDNLYFQPQECADPEAMARRYRAERAFAPLQGLLRGTHHLAIWDDHDYGPDDADSTFAFKGQSLELFRRYWANGNWGLPDAPGVFGSRRLGDVELFLLDDRSFRDPDSAPETPDKQLFGRRQIEWLQQALLASTARFKVIAAGGQLLHPAGRWEGWGRFPREREAFLEWLAANAVSGVLFLSGDRHLTDLIRVSRVNNYPLYELTCSPLTGRTFGIAGERPNVNRIDGSLVGENNFCLLEASGGPDDRRLGLSVHASDGGMLWRFEIPATDLVAERR